MTPGRQADAPAKWGSRGPGSPTRPPPALTTAFCTLGTVASDAATPVPHPLLFTFWKPPDLLSQLRQQQQRFSIFLISSLMIFRAWITQARPEATLDLETWDTHSASPSVLPVNPLEPHSSSQGARSSLGGRSAGQPPTIA